MGLKDIQLKEIYDSDNDNLINDFYIPTLSNSIKYKRISGFFSSSSLAVAARGMGQFILNGGSMQLICSAKLSDADIAMIKMAEKNPEEIIQEIALMDLGDFENEFIKNHVRALGWMLAKKKLAMKIAFLVDQNGIPVKNGILHPKIGILEDSMGDVVCFSGSNNETASGWQFNVEEFKVFPSWNESLRGYFEPTVEKFEEYWKNKGGRVRVINAPEAVEKRLINISKGFDQEDLKNLDDDQEMKKIHLRDYQKEAIANWSLKNCRGIFEMATGTGKTFTALGCASKLINKTHDPLVIVITCPFQHLITQWEKQVKKFNLVQDHLIIADGNRPWKDKLIDTLRELSIGYIKSIVIITTHNTFSSKLVELLFNQEKFFKAFLIADEMHGLGSPMRNKGLSELYDFRLGLSATPERWLDEEGTNLLFDYFNGLAFQFSLERAISEGYLTPYTYHPKFVELTKDELEEYHNQTIVIARTFSKKNEEEKEKALEKLLIRRSNIVKNSINKYKALREIINESGGKLNLTLVYTTDKQINRVMSIMNEYDIDSHRFTMEESLKQRDKILKHFEDRDYDAIVAMKCLDEGVDIPAAHNAILMASSGNPREYIQRIGRIIRNHPNKEYASIKDIVIKPSFDNLPSELKNIEKKIFDKEIDRYEKIAEIALNDSEALELIYKIKRRLRGD